MVDFSTPKKVIETLLRGSEVKLGEDCSERAFPRFHALFSLNGLRGMKDSGAHATEITCVGGTASLLRMTLLNGKGNQKVIDVSLKHLAGISILSRYQTTTQNGDSKLLGVAYRTPEIVLHFHSEIVLTTDCIWLWAENLRTRNIFVEHVDDLYSASFPNRPPLNIEQVKAHEVEAVHKEYTVEQKLNESNQPKNFFMMRRDRRLKKNHSKISCRLCNTLVSIYDLEKHAETCVEVEDIDVKCQLCSKTIRHSHIERHSVQCYEEMLRKDEGVLHLDADDGLEVIAETIV